MSGPTKKEAPTEARAKAGRPYEESTTGTPKAQPQIMPNAYGEIENQFGSPATPETEEQFVREAEEREEERNRIPEVHAIANNRGTVVYWMSTKNGGFNCRNEANAKKHLRRAGMSAVKGEDGFSEIDHYLLDRQEDSQLSYAGPLAGFDAGVHEVDGVRFLSTRSPITPELREGDFSTIDAVLNAMFPDEENKRRFMAWMFFAWQYLHKRKWAPMPVVAIAGPRASGKSLLKELISYTLGGTEPGEAIRFLRGETHFNANHAGCHLLSIDDAMSSTDGRHRMAIGSRFKQLAVTNRATIEPKGFDPSNLLPHWRVFVACNDEPESLLVLPPIDDGLQDKLLLLRCVRGEMPMPARTPEQRAAFMDHLKADVPGMLDHLSKQSWIHDYGDSRQVVTGWQDPELFDALCSLNAEAQLLDLIDILEPWDLTTGSWVGTAAELEGMLTDNPGTRRKAEQILRFHRACGQYLGRLKKSDPERVHKFGADRNYQWEVKAP